MFFLVLGVLFKYLQLKQIEQYFVRTILATVFYMSGYYMKKRYGKIKKSYLGIALFIPLIVAAFFWHVEMAGPEGAKGLLILPYYLLAICGTIALLTFSSFIIGERTLYILTFHFLAFKVVSAIYLYINGCSVESLVDFPVLRDSNSWLWIVYSVFGIIAPLAVWKLQNIMFN